VAEGCGNALSDLYGNQLNVIPSLSLSLSLSVCAIIWTDAIADLKPTKDSLVL